jgi:hypothetical protein
MTFASPSAIKLREYERIFTGSNQDVGYEHPILNFTSDTTLQEFIPDKVSYFHYPITAPSGLLVDSDLVNSGAIAGIIPHYSDKIWKKMANYSSSSIWGNSQPVGKQTGIWLCSWLSGDQTVLSGASGYSDPASPVWVDRWYNPGYIDSATALFVNTAPSAVLVDVISELSFEAGNYYRYYHVGSEKNNSIVSDLSGGNLLGLHVDHWDEDIIDSSAFQNPVVFNNFDSGMISDLGVNYRERPDDTCLVLNGTNQDCQVLHNSSFALSSDMSYSVWAYAEDWSNIQGNHIVSKNYRGGWSLKYDNGFYTPTMAVFDRNNGNIAFLNNQGSVLNSKALPDGSEPVAAVIDQNLFTWVLDNGIYEGSKHLYKMDYNGDIRSTINILSSEDLKCLSIDNFGYNDPALTDNPRLWVLGTSSYNAYDSLTLSGVDLLSGGAASTAEYCDISLSGAYFDSQYTFCFNNSGDTIYAGTTSTEPLDCDRDGNIWVLKGTNQFYKYDGTLDNFILSGTVGNSSEVSGRYVNFTNEYVDGAYKDYVWFLQEAERVIYKYDTNGGFIFQVDLTPYEINPAGLGDFTGYQRHRKFNYLENSKQPQIKADVTLNTTSYFGKNYTLSMGTSGLSDRDWHLFSFVCDTGDPTILSFYVDGVIRDRIDLSYDNYIDYEYENPLIVGANVGKLEDLDKELDLQQNHFNGRIDDLRIYNKVLNNSDVRYIYLNKYDYKPLRWNIPTGDRDYLEEIERFFKFKLPGLKSQYYNLRLIGLGITDTDTRELIENIIKDTIKKLTPAYAEMFKIIWE